MRKRPPAEIGDRAQWLPNFFLNSGSTRMRGGETKGEGRGGGVDGLGDGVGGGLGGLGFLCCLCLFGVLKEGEGEKGKKKRKE